jgi:ABC-type branched-subunit amino acid transport system substrate-binding protein
MTDERRIITPGPKRLVRVEDVIRRPVDRRAFLTWTARSSLAGLSLVGAFGTFAAACGGGDDGGGETSGTGGGGGGDLPPSLKIGVIAPLSGIAQFIGDIVQRSLGAAKQHIEERGLLSGTKVEYTIVDAPAEQFAQGTSNAYNELVADSDVIGILWCTPLGLTEATPQIQRDGIPVMAVYADPYSEAKLYPEGNGPRNVFQMLLPDTMSFDALCRYAAEDRGYGSVGLLYDSLTLPLASDQLEPAAQAHGLDVVAVEEFSLLSADYGAQLQRLKDAKPHCLIVWGVSDNTANIVKNLDDLGAAYVDTPTAKSGSTWAPQILGYPGGTGEKKWAELAGSSAKVGTLTAWYLGGLVGGPHFPIRDWLVEYDGTGASGGEEGAANALWALVEAVKRAGNTDRAQMVTALEAIPVIEFAGLPFRFDTDNHLGMTEDDVVLITLERYTGPAETDPPYILGREWTETFPLISSQYVGPAHLVRPTLEANLRAQPDYMEQILSEGWGTQCAKSPADALGLDVQMSKACKIH